MKEWIVTLRFKDEPSGNDPYFTKERLRDLIQNIDYAEAGLTHRVVSIQKADKK